MTLDLMKDIPADVLKAAAKVSAYFEEFGGLDWRLHGCASRKVLEQAEEALQATEQRLARAYIANRATSANMEKAVEEAHRLRLSALHERGWALKKLEACIEHMEHRTDQGAAAWAAGRAEIANAKRDAAANPYVNPYRIMACMKVCAGISTEVLELNAEAGGVATLERQRDRAECALRGAGWTYEEGAAEWKPPIGPSASPLLERIDQLESQRDQLLAALEGVTLTQDEIDLGISAVAERHAQACAVIAAVKGGAA